MDRVSIQMAWHFILARTLHDVLLNKVIYGWSIMSYSVVLKSKKLIMTWPTWWCQNASRLTMWNHIRPQAYLKFPWVFFKSDSLFLPFLAFSIFLLLVVNLEIIFRRIHVLALSSSLVLSYLGTQTHVFAFSRLTFSNFILVQTQEFK